ncbi:MAG: hypothetical protein M1832_002483 [Thelocarpon impressellum]|nr:MAG: hypothetical protein M1832_002483 [Thelocarpon impressellum]
MFVDRAHQPTSSVAGGFMPTNCRNDIGLRAPANKPRRESLGAEKLEVLRSVVGVVKESVEFAKGVGGKLQRPFRLTRTVKSLPWPLATRPPRHVVAIGEKSTLTGARWPETQTQRLPQRDFEADVRALQEERDRARAASGPENELWDSSEDWRWVPMRVRLPESGPTRAEHDAREPQTKLAFSDPLCFYRILDDNSLKFLDGHLQMMLKGFWKWDDGRLFGDDETRLQEAVDHVMNNATVCFRQKQGEYQS